MKKKEIWECYFHITYRSQISKPRLLTQKSRENPMYDRSEMPPKFHQMKPRGSVKTSQAEPIVPLDKIEQIMERVLKMSPK